MSESLNIFIDRAEVRHGPVINRGLTVEDLKHMNQYQLKKLGFTDLECLRIQQQFKPNSQAFWDDLDDFDETACRAELRKQDAHFAAYCRSTKKGRRKRIRNWMICIKKSIINNCAKMTTKVES